MNQLTLEKQRAIIQNYNRGYSVRLVADIVGCSPITTRTYLRQNGNRIRTISEGMIIYHRLRRGEPIHTLDEMLRHYNIPPIVKTVLSCGKTRKDCVDCGNIFSEGCGFCS